MFFLWPFIPFWYLAKTRGVTAGILLSISIILFYFAPYWIGDLAYALFGSEPE